MTIAGATGSIDRMVNRSAASDVIWTTQSAESEGDEAVEPRDGHDEHRGAHGEWVASSWAASVRLAAMFSVVAGLAALALSGHISDLSIVVIVIVAGTAVSWLQLESPPAPAPVRTRRSDADLGR
jgi:hypothetical protein